MGISITILFPFCFHFNVLSYPNKVIFVLELVLMSFSMTWFSGNLGRMAYTALFLAVKKASFTAKPGSGSTVCFKIEFPPT